MSRYWKYFYLGHIWCLPMTIIGFVLSYVFYKARSWAWVDGVLTCVAGTDTDGTTLIWGKPNAQTLGWIQIYDTEANRLLPDLRVHENVHVGQAFLLGLAGFVLFPLLFAVLGWPVWLGLILGGFAGALGFVLIYGILFLYLQTRHDHWYWAYRNNPFEVQAYDLQDKYLENPNSRPWGA